MKLREILDEGLLNMFKAECKELKKLNDALVKEKKYLVDLPKLMAGPDGPVYAGGIESTKKKIAELEAQIANTKYDGCK